MSLLSQKQGKSIDSFNNRFRTIAILVQFNDTSLRSLYLKAIKTELRQELYHCHPYPETLEATMSSCEIIESRINHINRLSVREQVRSFRNTSVDRRENQEERSQCNETDCETKQQMGRVIEERLDILYNFSCQTLVKRNVFYC